MRTIRSAKVFVRSRRSFSSFCILPYYFTLQAEGSRQGHFFGFAFFTADFLVLFFALLFPLPRSALAAR